jgi:hypothetical protein
MTEKKFVPIIRLDFDGVIHSYTTPNKPWNDTYIPDPVTPGFWRWFVEMTNAGMDMVVFSSRCKTSEGMAAIGAYLGREYKAWYKSDEAYRLGAVLPLPHHVFPSLRVVNEPVPAWITIDDRAVTFKGDWDEFSVEFIKNFKPWNK